VTTEEERVELKRSENENFEGYKKRTKIRWLIRKKNFVGDRYDFVMNSLI
jgi:hypothetical protein